MFLFRCDLLILLNYDDYCDCRLIITALCNNSEHLSLTW